MSQHETPGQGGYALRVVRVHAGQSITFLMLTDSLYGVLTRWEGRGREGRSVLCQEHAADWPGAKKMQWKGYIAALMAGSGTDGRWWPVVLEVTEHAELYLRDKLARNQVWNFHRSKIGKKVAPVSATLETTLNQSWQPPAFDILGVLRSVYRCLCDFPASVPNPLPAWSLVQPIEGPPIGQLGCDVGEQSRSSSEEIRNVLDAWRKKKAGANAGKGAGNGSSTTN
jgi:hypothetical protein